MKRTLVLALLALSGASCRAFLNGGREPLTPQQQAILVEETNPYRNEWLYQRCEVKDVKTVFTPNRARREASAVGANYVEVLYSQSPLNLNVVMFNCPEIPPY
jgi:hypothetical protein